MTPLQVSKRLRWERPAVDQHVCECSICILGVVTCCCVPVALARGSITGCCCAVLPSSKSLGWFLPSRKYWLVGFCQFLASVGQSWGRISFHPRQCSLSFALFSEYVWCSCLTRPTAAAINLWLSRTALTIWPMLSNEFSDFLVMRSMNDFKSGDRRLDSFFAWTERFRAPV